VRFLISFFKTEKKSMFHSNLYRNPNRIEFLDINFQSREEDLAPFQTLRARSTEYT